MLSERKEFRRKENTQNSKFKEENSSCFYSWGLQRAVVKKVCSIAFFFLLLLGGDSGVVIAGLLILFISVVLFDRLGMVWVGMSWISG